MNEVRVQILAIVAALLLLIGVLELVRRRSFLERYALLWLLSGVVLLALAVWRDALNLIADLLGIAAPTNALFFVAFGFVMVLLLHFSLAVSRLTDQTKVLAQRLALLEERQRDHQETTAAEQARADAGDEADDEERAGQLASRGGSR